MNDTVIDIPFIYQAEVIKKRCRKTSIVDIKDTFPLTIPVYTGSNNNVVLSYINRQRNIFGDIVPIDSCIYRRINDNLMTPLNKKEAHDNIKRSIFISKSIDNNHIYSDEEPLLLNVNDWNHYFKNHDTFLYDLLKSNKLASEIFHKYDILYNTFKCNTINENININDIKTYVSDNKQIVQKKITMALEKLKLCLYNNNFYIQNDVPCFRIVFDNIKEDCLQKIELNNHLINRLHDLLNISLPCYAIQGMKDILTNKNLSDTYMPNCHINVYDSQFLKDNYCIDIDVIKETINRLWHYNCDLRQYNWLQQADLSHLTLDDFKKIFSDLSKIHPNNTYIQNINTMFNYEYNIEDFTYFHNPSCAILADNNKIINFQPLCSRLNTMK